MTNKEHEEEVIAAIKKIYAGVYKGQAGPAEYTELLRQLSVLNVNIGIFMGVKEKMAFAKKNAWLSADAKLSDAKAETRLRETDEWEQYRKFKVMYESNQDVMNSLKYEIRRASDEKDDIKFGHN